MFSICRLTIYGLWCNEPKEPEDNLDLRVERGIDLENNGEKSEFEMVDEPKSRIIFKDEHVVIMYYKLYAKQAGFSVMTQRSKRESNGTIQYITLGCARGGKHKSRQTVVSKPCPTTKTKCKAKINTQLVNGEWCLTTVKLTHNHGLLIP